MDREESVLKLLLAEMQDAWLGKRYEDLNRFLHPDVIFMNHDLTGQLHGKRACLETFIEFGNEAQVKEFDSYDEQVCVWNDKAMITYHFAISYTIGGNLYRETGKDLLMLVKRGIDWKLIWRAMTDNQRI